MKQTVGDAAKEYSKRNDNYFFVYRIQSEEPLLLELIGRQ